MASPSAPVTMQALLLADVIYREQGTGKYILAGTFHQLNVSGFPTTFPRTVGVFASVLGLEGPADLAFEFVDDVDGNVLMRTQSLEISSDAPDVPVQLALEVPRLPLPHAGRYWVRLLMNGSVLGAAPVHVHDMESARHA
jgi:hypothetical protein